jgi:hypothetical protein
LSIYGEIFIYEYYEPTDVPNPSRHFIVYETGDNTTTILGEPESEDLFYSRAINWGDDFIVWTDEVLDPTLSQCYPSDPHDTDVPDAIVGSTFCNEFDDLESRRDSKSEEASVTATAWGDFLYSVWAQLNYEVGDDEVETFVGGDAMFRRVWWLDGYIPQEAWTLPGTGTGAP